MVLLQHFIGSWPLAWAAGGIAAILGSHVATLALRWPAGRSAATGRSTCDGCGVTLRPRDLVPLLSWIALGGRCRTCGGRIDPRHPLIELTAMLIGIGMMRVLPPGAAIAGIGLALALLLLVVLDIDHYWLPDRVTLPLLVAGLGVAALGIGPALFDRAIGAGVGWGLLALVAASYRRLRGRIGLGGGDAKLLGAIGAWLGWHALPFVLLGASVAGLSFVGAQALAGQRVTAADRVAFGPFLALAGVVGWILVAAG